MHAKTDPKIPHEGYPNYQTWNVHHWLRNDPWACGMLRRQLAYLATKPHAPQELSAEHFQRACAEHVFYDVPKQRGPRTPDGVLVQDLRQEKCHVDWHHLLNATFWQDEYQMLWAAAREGLRGLSGQAVRDSLTAFRERHRYTHLTDAADSAVRPCKESAPVHG